MSKSSNPVSLMDQVNARIEMVEPFLKSRRLAVFHCPNVLARISRRYHDRRIHDGVPDDDRPGFAIRSPDLTQLSYGLLRARYATLGSVDIPQTQADLRDFNRGLIVKGADTKTTVAVLHLVAEGLAGDFGDEQDLDAHADSLWALCRSRPDLFRAAVRGEIEHALMLARQITDDSERRSAVKTCARQAIVWGAFDVHRIAARGRSCKMSLVPPFIRSRLTTHTKNEYVGFLLSSTRWMLRLYEKGERAERLRPGSLVYPPGPRGPFLNLIEEPARKFETKLSQSTLVEQLAVVTPIIRAEMTALARRYEQELTDNKDSQKTLYQDTFGGLTEIASLCVTSLQYVQSEARLKKLLTDPDMEPDLSFLTNKKIDADYPTGSIGRAKAIAASYRSAVLRDENAKLLENYCLSDAKKSWKEAMEFLQRFSRRSSEQTLRIRCVMYDLNLSHHARAGGRLG